MLNEKQKKFQQDLVDKLKNDPTKYEEAAIYTVLLDLIQSSDADHVQEMLLEVADDLGYEININAKIQKK